MKPSNSEMHRVFGSIKLDMSERQDMSHASALAKIESEGNRL